MHTHDRSIIGLVLDGQMTLEWEEGSTTYGIGDVCEFAAGTLHAEKTGPGGTRLILGCKLANDSPSAPVAFLRGRGCGVAESSDMAAPG